MRGLSMLRIRRTAWIQKTTPTRGIFEAVTNPITDSPYHASTSITSGCMIGDQYDMMIGHEMFGWIVEIGIKEKNKLGIKGEGDQNEKQKN